MIGVELTNDVTGFLIIVFIGVISLNVLWWVIEEMLGSINNSVTLGLKDGDTDGEIEGLIDVDGLRLGLGDGLILALGLIDGDTEGLILGDNENDFDGEIDGLTDGDADGEIEGLIENDNDGETLGDKLELRLGDLLGLKLGDPDNVK